MMNMDATFTIVEELHSMLGTLVSTAKPSITNIKTENKIKTNSSSLNMALSTNTLQCYLSLHLNKLANM